MDRDEEETESCAPQKVFPSSFSIAALIGAAAIHRVGRLPWQGRQTTRRRSRSEEPEQEAKRPRQEEQSASPTQEEVSSLQAAARRLLRDPRELLVPQEEPGGGRANCARLEGVSCSLETKELWQKFFQLGTEMIITKSGRLVGGSDLLSPPP